MDVTNDLSGNFWIRSSSVSMLRNSRIAVFLTLSNIKTLIFYKNLILICLRQHFFSYYTKLMIKGENGDQNRSKEVECYGFAIVHF